MSEQRKKLLEVEDVAQWVGVSEATIYRWVAEGRIPHIRLSGRNGALRFEEGRIRAWLDERAVTP